MTIALIAAAIVVAFILGVRVGINTYGRLFRTLRDRKLIEMYVEERGARAVALVMVMPAEYRELANKIIDKMKEKP